jgi:replication-associated recombination protein RarA
MRIEIKKNNCPNLGKVNFACDRELSSKLNQYELVRDHLNKYNTTLLIGTQGSGKTSLLVNFVKKLYKKVFDKVYVFMPSTSRQSLNPNIFEVLPEEQLFEELNEETIRHVYEEAKTLSEEGKKTLIIYDDVQRALKNQAVLNSLKNIIANQRHLHVVNLILVQNFFALHKSLREIVNNIILFKLGKSQTDKVFNEIIELHRDKFDKIRDMVYDEKYNWLFVNIASQRIYKKFDEIVFEEEDEVNDGLEKK